MRFSALHLLVLPSVAVLALAATAAPTPPDFSGTWKLDHEKSQGAPAPMITLQIKNDEGKVVYERSDSEGGGKQVVYRFSCAPGGSECDFDENGHKAKVSLWYDGPALMILKTNGPKEDATTERKVVLSPDGKTLTVELTNYAGNDKAEKLVFLKQ